jgi:hypothetical protein
VVASAVNNYGMKVAYGSPFADFEGKGVCGSPQDIHGVVTQPSASEGLLTIASQQSFHPTIGGAGDYAHTATTTLPSLAGM